MRITLALLVASTIAMFLFALPTNGGRQDRDVVLSINDPRPLAEAARLLESKLGRAVSYEDVALVYSGDYARALDTDWGRKYAEQDARFKAMNRIGSVGGSLDIRVAIDTASGTPVLPVTQILQDVIDQHKARGNPGQFQLLPIGDAFVVVPTAKRDTNGMFIPEYSPLDSPISFPVAVRSGAETLKVICEAVTNASGRRLSEGLAPKLLFNTVVEVGADHETARDVLVRAWRGLRWADGRSFPSIPKMSWHLLCAPNRAMTTVPPPADVLCALNLQTVQ